MLKIFTLAKWEFLEKIKRKSFLAYMFIFPSLIILLGLLPKLISDNSEEPTKAVGIVDATDKFYESFSEKLDIIVLPNQQPRYITAVFNRGSTIDENITSANYELKRGTIDGYLFIYSSDADINLQYRSTNVSGIKDQKIFESVFNEVITEYNLIQRGVPKERTKDIIGDVNLISVQISDEGIQLEKDFLSVFFNSYILLMLLTMTVVFSGGTFVRSLINEKSNGILEVILSSVNVDQLLSGKILGLIYLSLFQFLVWGVIGYFISQNSMIVSFEMSLSFIFQIIYFMLGYILFITIFVGLGSVVSTEQGAQQITGIVTTILIFPIVIASIVIQNPESVLTQILTYFPLTTSSIQLLKLNFYTPSVWEVSATFLILIFSIYLVIKFSAKIFKVGVLHFDKTPAIKLLKRIFN